MEGTVQGSRWIVTCHPVLDDKRGDRGFGVAGEEHVVPEAQAQYEIELRALTVQDFRLGYRIAVETTKVGRINGHAAVFR